jgi:hypothetical protein
MQLGLDTFLAGTQDLESRQYLVLRGLKEARTDFSQSRLYPALQELVNLHAALGDILQRKGDIQSHLPQNLKSVDLKNRTLVYDPVANPDSDLERTASLITWALPLIRNAIEEGMEIFNFVEAHITIEQVGILPMYIEEGYWFVPDRRTSVMHLLRYEASLFTSARERYRTLKTRHLEVIEESWIRRSPESLKLGLIEKYMDLPNPATFACETDIDFPFTETMMPISKRKLMARVFS